MPESFAGRFVTRGVRQAWLIAAIVLLQLALVFTLVLRLQRELANEFSANAEVTLDALADGAIDRTQRLLGPVLDAVSVGVELLDEGVIDGDDDAALGIYFTAQLTATPWLSGVYLGRPDGSFVYIARNEFGLRTKRISVTGGVRDVELVQRDPGGTITERWTDADDDYDPRERTWYRLAQASETLAWTAPYIFFSSGLPGISTARRTRNGLVLGADVELQQLSAFIERIPHAESGTALIIDDALSVIARSGTDATRAGVPSGEVPTLAEVAPSALLALNTASESDRSGDGLVELEIEQRTFLGLARAFPIADNAPSWTLLAQMRADDYAGGALNFLNRQIVLLGAISLALGLAALGGVLWLYRAGARSIDDATRDPTTGVLTPARFTELLQTRFAENVCSPETCRGVMIIEACGLTRLTDRHGSGCREAVLTKIARCLEGVLEDPDLVGVSPTGRYRVAVGADSRSALLERFRHVHETVAGEAVFTTPSGPQELAIASGAAVLENGEPLDNLLQRAREALALGLDNERSGYQLAPGLDAHRLDRSTSDR